MIERFLLVRPYYGINVHTDAQGEYGTVLGSNDVFPDLPLITAATILNESDSHEVKVIDAVTEDRMLPDELLRKIALLEYDKVLVKSTAPTFKADLELCRQIKAGNPSAYVMIAGQAVRHLKDWIYANTDIDLAIEEPVDMYIYRYVHGAAATVSDMPTPDYTLVNYRKYTDDYNNIRLTIQASRGCPMSCAYCPYIKYYGKYESRDADKVIGDLKAVTSLGADLIQFRDQFFTCDSKRIRELCRRIIDEGINVRWICETRLDSLTPDLIDLMKEAGLFLICFGVESGDQNILTEYNSNKGNIDYQRSTVEYIKNAGILTMAFYITGFPEDTWETLHATYRYADTVNSDIAAFNEYTEFNLSSESDISPDIFCSFENATAAKGLSSLSKEEIRYAVELFSTMYTLKHDTLEKAYNYNHKQLCDSRRLASKLKGHENDLDELSRIIRESS